MSGVLHGMLATMSPPPIVSTNLVTHLNGSSYSGSGSTWTNLVNGNANATLFNSPTYNGVNGFNFNGSTQRATIARNVADDFTLSCWFRTSTTGNYAGLDHFYGGLALLYADVGGETNDFALSIFNGKPYFGTGNPSVTARTSASYADGVWHYAVGVRDATANPATVKVYVDAVETASTTSTNRGSLTAPTTIDIGASSNGYAYFNGDIGAILIYGKALNAAEVSQNWQATRGTFGR